MVGEHLEEVAGELGVALEVERQPASVAEAQRHGQELVLVVEVEPLDLGLEAARKLRIGHARLGWTTPPRSSAARICATSPGVASTSGRRTPPTSWPTRFSAALVEIGFTTPPIASSTGWIDSEIASAPSPSPSL